MNNIPRTIILADSEEIDYNNQIKKNPSFYSGIFSDAPYHPCPCDCHCRPHVLTHKISYCNNKYTNLLDLNSEKRYNNNSNHVRNKSMANIINKDNKNFIDELRKKYGNSYANRDNKKYYNNKCNIYLYKPNVESETESIIKNNNNKIKKNNIISNSYKDIDINKKNEQIIHYINDIKPKYSFNVNKNVTSKYYHSITPKKYSYGGENLQTVSNTNNHRYKEIFCTSKPNDIKKFDENNAFSFNGIDNNKSQYISRIDNNNTMKIEINDENSLKNNNLKNPTYINYRYDNSKIPPNDITRNISMVLKDPKSEINTKVVKETYNTRLVDLKNLKNKNNTFNQNLLNNQDINTDYNKNNLNTLSYDTAIKLPYSYLLKQTKKDNIIKLSNKSNNNKEYDNNNNYYKVNAYISNKKHIPKSYSLSNINNKKVPSTYHFKTIENDYDFKYLNNYNNKNTNDINNNVNIINKNNIKNKDNINNNDLNDFNNNNICYKNNINNNNKVDYEILKQSVKLALLRKHINELKRQKKPNNEQNKIDLNDIKNKKYLERYITTGEKSSVNLEDNIFDRTRQIMEQKQLKNNKKKLNNHTKNNFRDKVTHNKNLIKPKIKVWKP